LLSKPACGLGFEIGGDRVREGDLEQLLRLARDKSAASRRALAASAADLFRSGSTVLTDRERFLMTEIVRQLIGEIEAALRRGLAERLPAKTQRAPELPALAASDIHGSALAVLRRSEVLQDEELVEIVTHRSLEHQLASAVRSAASAGRSAAHRGGGAGDVIRTLLDSPDTAIKAATLAYLVEQSNRVDTFQNPRLQRRELGPALAQRLCWWVSAAMRQHLVERAAVDPGRLDRALEEIVAALASEANEEAPAAALSAQLARRRQIPPDLLIDTLAQGEIALFAALLAHLTELRPRLINRLIFEPGGEGLAIACKAIGLAHGAFAAIFALSAKARAPAPGETERVGSFFDRLDREAARIIVKGWGRDPGYQRALWQVESGLHSPVQG